MLSRTSVRRSEVIVVPYEGSCLTISFDELRDGSIGSLSGLYTTRSRTTSHKLKQEERYNNFHRIRIHAVFTGPATQYHDHQ